MTYPIAELREFRKLLRSIDSLDELCDDEATAAVAVISLCHKITEEWPSTRALYQDRPQRDRVYYSFPRAGKI